MEAVLEHDDRTAMLFVALFNYKKVSSLGLE